MKKLNNKGFTIVELTLASAIFAVVLLMVTIGLLQIGRAFSKSVNEAKVTEAARLITEDITRAIKFSGSSIEPAITPNGSSTGFCVGNRRYSYIIDQHIATPSTHGFVIDNLTGCNAATTAQNINGGLSPTSTEMLGERMALDGFEIVPMAQSAGYYRVTVRVIIYSNNFDVQDDGTGTGRRVCSASLVGTHYCAVAELTTLVQKRLD